MSAHTRPDRRRINEVLTDAVHTLRRPDGIAPSHRRPRRRRVSHIVWDWNGTLVDDVRACWAACCLAVADLGGQPPTFEDYRRTVDPTDLATCYGQMLGRTLPPQAWDDVMAAWDRHYAAEAAVDGALRATAAHAMAAWTAAGGSQSLLSLARHDLVIAQAQRFGVTTLKLIEGRHEARRYDSKGPALAAHLQALRIEAHHTVVIGDTTADAQAAASVGARCVLFTGGVQHRDRLTETGLPVADCLIDAVQLCTTWM